MKDLLKKSLIYVKGIGPQRATILSEDLGLNTIEDLLYTYPFRYVDKSVILSINEISTSDNVLPKLKAKLISIVARTTR